MFRLLVAIVILSCTVAGCGAGRVASSKEDPVGFYQRDTASRHNRQPHTVHRVPRDGHLLHVKEFSPAQSVTGPPLIVMHGFPDSLHLYDRLAPLLAVERRVIAFDFLGWGNSDTPDKHSYDVASLRRDLDVVINHFNLDKVILVVHDASGLPGIDRALDHPAQTAGLVLLNTLYAPSEHHVMPPSIQQLSTPGPLRELMAFGIKRSDRQWQQGLIAQLSEFFVNPEIRDIYTTLFAQQALAIRPAFLGLTAVWQDEVRSRANRLPELRALQVPSKIIFGVVDPYLTPNLAREFHGLLPNSELHLIENAGHYVQLDAPEAVAAAILSPWPSS